MKNVNTYITHIIADTANGVQKVDCIDYVELDLINFRDFMDQLPALEDGEVIYTAVNPDELEELEKEYSVN